MRWLAYALAMAVLVSGCALTQPPARAEIACADSYLQYARGGNYKCEEFGTVTGLTQSTAKTFDLFGALPDGTRMSLAVLKAWGIRTQLTLNYPVDTGTAIKDYNALTKKAARWTPSRSIGPYSVVEFEAETRHCHGFTRWAALPTAAMTTIYGATSARRGRRRSPTTSSAPSPATSS